MDRTGYIGAGDVPVILQKSTFKSRKQLWEEKVGLAVDTFTGNLATDLGHYTEPKCAQLAFEFLKKELNNEALELIDPEDRQVTCPEFVPLKARPDRYIINKKFGPSDDELINLECKTAFSTGSRRKWEAGVPEAYYWQVQAQMLCTGIVTSYIAAVTEGPDFFCYKIKADYDAQQKILTECKLFWDCVLNKTMPILDKIESEEVSYLTDDADADSAISRYVDLKAEIDMRQSELNQIKNDLSSFIKTSAGYKHEGYSAIWVRRKPSKAFDAIAAERYLKQNYEGNIDEFYKEKLGSSYIRIASKNN